MFANEPKRMPRRQLRLGNREIMAIAGQNRQLGLTNSLLDFTYLIQ